MKRRPPILLPLAWLAACLVPVAAPGQANVDVTGLGFFGNIEMERRLAFLGGGSTNETRELTVAEVEDLAYILLQLLRKEGHPRPSVTARIRLADGSERTLEWSLPLVAAAAEADAADWVPESVVLACEPGLLRYYEAVEISGVTSMRPSTLQGFFIPSGVLFTSRGDRAFTEGNLEGRVSRLIAALQSEGYSAARVVEKQLQADEETGAVWVSLRIEEGRLHVVGEARIEITGDVQLEWEARLAGKSGELLTSAWLREQRQALLNELYHGGYPDARVRVEQLAESGGSEGPVRVDLVYHVNPGVRVRMDGYVFKPEGILRFSVLERQTNLHLLEHYDLLAVEEGRRQLLSLGVFRDVELEHRATGPDRRQAVYTLHPAPRHTLRLRLGYGSYEMGRIGFRYERLNLWQRAHRIEILGKQSFKSTTFDASYGIPHFFDKRITGYLRAGYEFREEISYDRSTSRFVVGASRRLGLAGAEVAAEYALEKIDTRRDSDEAFESLDRATVASLGLRGVLDRRDSPLYPTRGFDLGVHAKVGTDLLGGEANFRRLELSASYHKYLGSALYLHAGLRFGAIYSKAPTAENLPFNERFFAGGENSVRGYKRGEATSLTEAGEPIGVESMALVNFELEQLILRNFSVALFWDGIAIERERSGFPDEEFLHSVGLGLRWRTPVGPVRLEYGYNLARRPFDPAGSLHLAVGFPF